MRYITSKFNIHARSLSLIGNDTERVILNVLLWSFAAFGLAYILLLGNMVFNIVERQALETRVRALTTEVRELEVAYLSVSSEVGLELSRSMGFVETKPVFVTRQSLGLAPGSSLGNISTANDL